jgi:hypothetical protein
LCNATGFGSINLTAGGGIPPYNYLWSNNSTTEDLNNLSVGVYSVSVSDVNGCSATQTLTITEPVILTTSVVSNNVLCNGENNGSINLSANGGTAPYIYLWSNNATTEDIANLAPGVYTVAISDANGCTTTSSTTISEPASYSIAAIISDETIGNDGAINLDIQGANPPYIFSWNNAQTTEDLAGLIGGNYIVTISDANNCDTILTFNVPTVVSTGQIAADKGLLLYPNPAYSYIVLTAQSLLNAQIITIFDATGKEIESFYNASLPLEMDIKNFSPGLYIIRIQEHDKVVNLKFVKKL